MPDKSRLDLDNENAYLTMALITVTRVLENMKDNLEAGRFQIVVIDDGAPHLGNMDAAKEAIAYATKCLGNTGCNS